MEKSRLIAILAFLALLCPAGVQGEDVHPITKRRIAQVMGPAGSAWLVRPEREAEEHPDQALDALQIPRGAVVADIGAGVGYMTWRLAQRVGPNGVVYGEDIQQSMLDQLGKNMRTRGIRNVRPVLGAIDNPKLPDESLDLVLLVDVYHEFSEPEKMLQNIRRALKPAGGLCCWSIAVKTRRFPFAPNTR
jgi:SAM-dependent methyltransferase